MKFRAIALSIVLLIGLGVFIPIATELAEAGPRMHRPRVKQKKRRHVKKYSKRWWRNRRARLRRQRAIRARQRALRLRRIRLARKRGVQNGNRTVAVSTPKAPKSLTVAPRQREAAQAITAQDPGELKFRVDDSAGSQVGSASISVIGPAVGDSSMTGRNKAVGGVSTTALRREVINKMIQENGWVVNDYQKQIGGREVYVVVAQSQSKNGRVLSRMFYFTEVDGRIYNVATNSPVESSERLAEESEKVINSIQSRVKPALRASTKD